jgi:putative ABC transport system permease protein
MIADFRHAARTLRRSPAFTLAAIATLAIGIGATASIFSVFNSVLLRPLPLIDPDRIVMVRTNNIERGWFGSTLSGPDFIDARAETNAFEAMAATMMRNAEFTGRGDPAEVTLALVGRDFFRVMPAKPLAGRVFTPEEFIGTQPPNVTILGETTWRTRFGSDPSVIGQSVTINGTPRTIIGVVPRATSWPRLAGSPEFFFALPEMFSTFPRSAHALEVIARLKPGATIEAAQTELASLSARQARDFPQSNKGWVMTATLVNDEVVGNARPLLRILLGAVGFVLLIVCANVASLLVARASARHHEIAIRRALGASNGRIVRHVAAESMLLSVTGGALGILLSLWAVDLLRRLADAALPRIDTVTVDARVVLFTIALTALTALLCGIIPAAAAARGKLQDLLKDGARVAAPRRGRFGRGTLVVSEIALAVILLVGAGLMARSFERMRTIPLGYDPRNVIAVDLDLPSSRYQAPESREQIIKRVEERISRLPGVLGVGTTRALPLESGGPDVEFTIDGQPAIQAGQPAPNAYYTAVTPGYFRAMGMSLARGRGLQDADDHPTADRVVVVNETTVRRFWSGTNPVGARITLGDGKKAEVVGVVRDVRQRFLTNAVEPQMFVAWAQAPELSASMVVRTSGDPGTLVPSMHREVWAVDPNLPVEEWTLEWLMSQSIATSKFQTTLLIWFAAVALLLAAMGVYALISYAVAQRTREIGVRMALGAARRDVVAMVLRQGVRLAIAGVAIGTLGAYYLTQFLTRVLYEVTPSDPLSHAAAAVTLGLVAALATYIPARRAATVDPVVALRDER